MLPLDTIQPMNLVLKLLLLCFQKMVSLSLIIEELLFLFWGLILIGNTIVTRGADDTMKVWDIRKLTVGPLIVFDDLPNKYQETDAVFSPDGNVICTGIIMNVIIYFFVFYSNRYKSRQRP